MKIDNKFDKKLEVWGNRLSDDKRQAFVNVCDDLDMCQAIAESVFEAKPTPDQVLAIYDRVHHEEEGLRARRAREGTE